MIMKNRIKKLGKYTLLTIVSVIVLVYLSVFITFRVSRYSQRGDILALSKIMQLKEGPMEYAISGQGPAFLFFHGALGGCDQLNAFKIDGFTTITPSRPGYLRTPLLDCWQTYQQSSAAFVELLDSLNIDKVVVGGISAGGPAALYFAMLYPDRVSSLVLISAITKERVLPIVENKTPFINNFFGEDFMAWVQIKMLRRNPDYILKGKNVMLSEHDQKIIAADSVKLQALFSFFDHSYTFLSKRLEGHVNDRIQYSKIGEPNPLPISVPTLIIHGTDDSNVDYEYALSASKRIANSKLVTLNGAGHVAIISELERVQKEIKDFINNNTIN